jgi:hypothetical protein
MGGDDVIKSVTLHVRAGDAVVAPIIQLSLDNDWQAIDYGSGEFLEHSHDPGAGLAAWRAYRDQIIGGSR